MAGWIFHTPGWVEEKLPSSFHQDWHDWHVGEADQNLAQMLQLLGSDDPADVPYVNPARQPISEERSQVSVGWEGFPAAVTSRFGAGDTALAEVETTGYFDAGPDELELIAVDEEGNEVEAKTRHRQDEYLEWHAKSENGKLRSITFVAEGYDYWQFLFERAEDHAVALYAEYTGNANLTADDLRAPSNIDLAIVRDGRLRRIRRLVNRGDLNPRNQFNQRDGIVHLSHRANSLGAEVNLAITSALGRDDANGNPVDGSNPKKLLCCTTGGEPNRSSDPIIAAGAYGAVTDPDEPKLFTLSDPVGLYIREYRFRSLNDPSGNPAPKEFWKVVRGRDATLANRKDSRILRLHLEVPEGEGYSLGDMKIDNTPITAPGQLASLIGMHLLVDVWKAPRAARRLPCNGGCCRDANGLLSTYSPFDDRLPRDCGGNEIAFPGLVDPAPRAGDPTAGLKTRRML